MAAGIRIEMSETALAVNPGGAVTTRCTVYNASFIVDEYRIEISGLDPSWVEYPKSTTRIFPEAIETITLTFQPPRSSGIAAGDYPFVVTASSADNPALTATSNGVLTIDAFVDFTLDLVSPRQISGEIEGSFTLRLANTGNSRLTIALDAAEETQQLDFTFSEQLVEIDGNENKEVTLTARPNARSLGSAAVYQITIGGAVAQIGGAPSNASERKVVAVTLQTVPGVHEPPVLSPQSVELSGQHAQTQLVLRNKSALPLQMKLSANDKAHALAFEFVGGDSITVPPQDSLNVPIRITCLDRTLLAAPPVPTYFTVIATPTQPSGDPRTVQGELTLPGPADFRLRLEPEIIESTVKEQALLTIENVSGRTASFVLSATSKDTSLSVAVATNEVEIPARDRVSVAVDLTPNVDAMAGTSTGRPSGYTIRVAAADSPAHSNEISGQYVFTPAAITMHLRRKEIEAVAEATFDVEIENGGKNEVTVALSASDRAGACSYVFDLPRVRVNGRSTTVVRLTVTPPVEHKSDARWEFSVEARPVSPPGASIKDSGVLIYGSPSVTLALSPAERRGRRARKYDLVITNPTSLNMTAKITARDNSGGLGIQIARDTVTLEPSRAVTVPIKITPWRRSRSAGEASLAFTVATTPVSPPGDASTIEGRFVALPARSRWFWIGIFAIILLAVLFSPLYTEAFYAAGWKETRAWTEIDANGSKTEHEKSGKHTFRSDVSCVFNRVVDGDAKEIRNLCFAQGPKPKNVPASTLVPVALTPTP